MPLTINNDPESPWIACRLIHPSDDREVIGRNANNLAFPGEFVRWIDGQWVGRNRVVYQGITHWLPLPDLYASDA